MDKSVNRNARIYRDREALSRAAAEESAQRAIDAVEARGRCLVSLSGGHTPARMYELWARDYGDKMPWKHMHFFWGDERFVPADDPQSNFRMAREDLLERLPIPQENVHPMQTNFSLAEDAAEAYETLLRTFFAGSGPSFDILFLGVGTEGHTASLFPEAQALKERKRWVVAVRAPVEPPVRISLTFPVLRRARNTYFLLAGAEKQNIVSVLRKHAEAGIAQLPVELLQPEGNVIWFLDEAASGGVGE